MLVTYLAHFRDRVAEEQTLIYNDGHILQFTARGVTFRGSDFETFTPVTIPTNYDLLPFTFWGDTLCAYELTCFIPLLITNHDEYERATLAVHVDLGSPQQKSLTHFQLQLALIFADQRIHSNGRHKGDTFDEQLLNLADRLPDNIRPICCHTCAFSDYAPDGSGTFGNMNCYRDAKVTYLLVKTKCDFIQLPATEVVQETYLCPEYAPRISGTGYRG